MSGDIIEPGPILDIFAKTCRAWNGLARVLA